MESEKQSLLNTLNTPKRYWAIACYVSTSLTLILSITVLILLHYLDGLNLLNQFLFYSESIIQLLIQSLLILAILSKKKTVILGCTVFGLLIAAGFLLTIIVITISQYVQIYSDNSPAPLVPAHSDMWYKIMNWMTWTSFIQGITAISACVSALKIRDGIPDLVPRAVFRKDDEEERDLEDTPDPKILAKFENLKISNASEREDDDSNIISVSYSKAASNLRENLLSNY